MAVLKMGLYLGNCCLWSKNKLNFDPRGRKRVYVQLLELWPMAKCYAQIWKSNWKSASFLETAARWTKISSISLPWDRQRVYVQLLGDWSMAKYMPTAAGHRAKVSSISTPEVKKGVYMNVYLLELWPIGHSIFIPKYGNFENRPVSQKPLPVEWK